MDIPNITNIHSTVSVTKLLVISAICPLVWIVVRWTRNHDPREPSYIHPSIPFIGHLIGMIRYGAKYFEYVKFVSSTLTQKHDTIDLADLHSARRNHPIFTLPILNSRNYIIADATIAGQIQRNNKTLSFYSIIVEVTRRLIAFDENAARITFDNINGDKGPGGLMEAVHEMLNRHLAPGVALDAMTAVQMRKTGEMLEMEVPMGEGSVEVDLYAWLRHIFSVCNAEAIYGPQNIFAVHPELEEEFWKFEDGMLGLVIDVVPQITARKAFYSRKRVLGGLIEYVETGAYKKASPLIQERVSTNLNFGIGEQMSGHAELILMFGILGNAVPSNFWLVANIFSRPTILARVREEVEAAIRVSQQSNDENDEKSPNGRRQCFISSKVITKLCPLLYGCYRETLRDVSLLTSARLVTEDTVAGDRYLLRKNSVVQIAGGVLHHSSDIWGHDANDFNPDRFLSFEGNADKAQASPLPKGVPSAAFRAFGGGTVICPGRHFAQSELMTLAAVLSVGFHLTEPNGDPLKLPQKDEERIPLAMVKPKWDPKVKVSRRKDWEEVHWIVTV